MKFEWPNDNLGIKIMKGKIVWYVAAWAEGEETNVFLLVIATDCRLSLGEMCTG